MWCRKCGKEIPDDSTVCMGCGRSVPVSPTHAVPTYLTPAILVTLFCCQPAGVVAIIFSAKVPKCLADGNMRAALDASEKARLFCLIAFGAGLLSVIIYIASLIVSGDFPECFQKTELLRI